MLPDVVPCGAIVNIVNLRFNKRRMGLTDNPYIYDICLIPAQLGRAKINQLIKKEVNLGNDSKDKILDVGCGTGAITGLFPKECYNGIDVNSKCISYTRNKWPDYNFSVMDGRKIEFPDNHFDWIISTFTFHHFEDSVLMEILSEMNRCLKPDGKVLIVDQISLQNVLGKFVLWLDSGNWNRSSDALVRITSSVLNIDKSYISKIPFATLFIVPTNITVIIASKNNVIKPKLERVP